MFCTWEISMKTRILVLTLCLAVAPLVRADVKPHAICSEGMVLQQQTKAKIWGTADPGEGVAVAFRDSAAGTTADAQGRWVVEIDTGKSGGPHGMLIKGKNTIAYRDV